MENSAVDVIVIGGGILGATLSRELALGGADVVLVDPDDAPNRVSVGSLAWLNASSTANPEYAAPASLTDKSSASSPAESLRSK